MRLILYGTNIKLAEPRCNTKTFMNNMYFIVTVPTSIYQQADGNDFPIEKLVVIVSVQIIVQ